MNILVTGTNGQLGEEFEIYRDNNHPINKSNKMKTERLSWNVKKLLSFYTLLLNSVVVSGLHKYFHPTKDLLIGNPQKAKALPDDFN